MTRKILALFDENWFFYPRKSEFCFYDIVDSACINYLSFENAVLEW